MFDTGPRSWLARTRNPAFGAAHGQEIEDAGHLGQGAKLIETRQGALPLDIPLKSSEIWDPEFRSQKPEWSVRGFASLWLLAEFLKREQNSRCAVHNGLTPPNGLWSAPMVLRCHRCVFRASRQQSISRSACPK